MSSPPAKGQLQQEIQRLSQKIYQHPIDENRKFTLGASTIERWYYKAKEADDPVVVLGRKPRFDAGIRWSMPEALLDASGNWLQPMVLAILDDHSRICCHLQFYLAETAQCLVHGLIQAFMKRRLPRSLMTDNGSAMLAEETTQGLARLGW
ncbi:integrase family protein [Desulfobacter postgatei 2ac9]|uniref:Integrase family protein n=1 Tax=Desulfobacter postgatei 2ac9 TaxID=879212 RepID=I5B775_9BACT|nr:hypothetical protein [Desulfobacter postgatei]EIM65338.1 integrase family protein [Desulfobacter postgatei 2ac9]